MNASLIVVLHIANLFDSLPPQGVDARDFVFDTGPKKPLALACLEPTGFLPGAHRGPEGVVLRLQEIPQSVR